jgi:hypothetical protein
MYVKGKRGEPMAEMDKPYGCSICLERLGFFDVYEVNGSVYCKQCYQLITEKEVGINVYNEPEHYHKHDIDTIEFLKRGFPPEVFMSFALGHIIKYAQRANYKNGREDYVKMVDYAKRALEWYDETAKNPS